MTVFEIRLTINLVYFITCAIVARKIMKKKGYCEEANTWFWLGLLIGIFALIIVILKPKKDESENNKPTE